MSSISRATDISDHTSTLFEPLITELMTVRQSSTDLAKEVVNFAEVTKSRKSLGASAAGEAGEILRNQIEDVFAKIKDSQQKNRESDIGVLNDSLRSCARELEMLSSLTLIVTAQVDQSEFDRESFIADIRSLSRRLVDAAGKIEDAMQETRTNRTKISKCLIAASQDLKVLTEIQFTNDNNLPETEGDISATVDEAKTFKDGIAENTRSMVACMQHPDALRQRAEHVDVIIKKAEEAEPPLAQILNRLASMQCRHMSDELSLIVGDAKVALGDMLSSGRNAAEQIRAGLLADDRTAQLNERRKEIVNVVDLVKVAHEQTQDALAGLQHMHHLLEEGTSLFEILNSERNAVRISAFNASLAEKRLGKRAVGMNVLTQATRDASEQCSTTIEQMTGLMKSVTSDALDINVDGLETAFSETQTAVDNDQNSLNELIKDIDTVTQAASSCEASIQYLLNAAEIALSRLQGMETAIQDLAELSTKLDQSVTLEEGTDTSTIQAILNEIRETYTMETERIPHQQLIEELGFDEGVEAVVTEVPEEQGLDDIFF